MLMTLNAQGQVVINEIHYDPDVKTEAVEFIELHNAGASVVDLSGWRLDDGIDYVFPAGTFLAAGGYRVIAENISDFRDKFGATPLGPWTGKLDNDGERIRLRDATGIVMDSVDYGCGFPWPIRSRGGGASMELIDPALDNDLGGAWRPSGGYGDSAQITLLPQGSDWMVRKGTSEASSPREAWRAPDFAEDKTWTAGTAPIGYGEGHIVTVIDDMRTNYRCLFFRKRFTIDDPALIASLLLRAQFDDGINVWINGTHVLSHGVASADLPYDSLASLNRQNETAFQEFVLPDPSQYLVAGADNLIAVQVHNITDTSSDCTWEAELVAGPPSGGGPTPGSVNSVRATGAPPMMRQVAHSPQQPQSGQAVIITTKATDPDGIDTVTLSYQVVDSGAYIRLSDGLYQTKWTDMDMVDDGTNGDATAGDSVFTATLPGAVQAHRRLVRYRITARDGAGQTLQAPYADDPVPNFAYFVYNGVPAWSGAYHPGGSAPDNAVVTYSPDVLNTLPVYHLISKEQDVLNCQYNSSYRTGEYIFPGTIVYDGEVYDHVFYRIKGAASTYTTGKNKWKFNFPRGHAFQARDNYGKKYDVKWDKLIFSTGTCPWWQYPHPAPPGNTSYWDKSTEGMVMNEALAMRFYQLAGVPASNTQFVHFRVIDRAQETDFANQYEGDFWGLYIAIEQVDGRFLDEHDLPDGNFFKMAGGGSHLTNQGPDQPDNLSDLNQFRSATTGYNNPNQPLSWWEANCDLDGYYRFQAVSVATNNSDRRPEWNCMYYAHPETGRWTMIPWDLDLSFEYGPHYTDMEHWRYVLAHEQAAIDYANTARSLRDLLFNSDQAAQVIDEYAGFLTRGPGQPDFTMANRAKWEHHPRVPSNRQGKFYQNNEYIAFLRDYSFNGLIAYLKRFLSGESWPDGVWMSSSYVYGGLALLRDGADPLIPDTPVIDYRGKAGYPVNQLTFGVNNFSAPRGGGSFAAIEWRIGEVTDPAAPNYDPDDRIQYEVEAVWESGEQTTGANTVLIPFDALRVGSAYRARVRMKDTTGRKSHWSAPIQFIAGEPDQTVLLQSSLRITEVMYDPPAGSDFEFIEIFNRNETRTLNLSGVVLDSGVTFLFPAGLTLAPREYLLVSGSDPTNAFAALRAQYGLAADLQITGPYSGNLANGGERLRLRTAIGGVDIVDFEYSDNRGWPLAAQGGGHSLVPLNDLVTSNSADNALDYPFHWRASTLWGGSPGAPDPAPALSLRLNEFAAHTDTGRPAPDDSNDWIELVNPTPATIILNDWYLSDDVTQPTKWAIPHGTTIAPGGFLFFDEAEDFHSPRTTGFGLDKAGEELILSHLPGDETNRIVDAVAFKGQENQRSLGRWPDGTGSWRTMDRTPGVANTAPITEVVIEEIMYHPSNDQETCEYVGVVNPTNQTIPLWNESGPWRLNGAVAYTFPPNVSLAPGERWAIVAFDPKDPTRLQTFRTTHWLGDRELFLLGPMTGGLGNRTGRIALERPQAADPPDVDLSWVLVDEVHYFDRAPFSTSADGQGFALRRQTAQGDSLDPRNWPAAIPMPGVRNAFLLTTSTQHGRIEITPLRMRYEAGIAVTGRAVPDAQYRFLRWEGDVPAREVSTNPLTITMDQDILLRPLFVPIATTRSSAGWQIY